MSNSSVYEPIAHLIKEDKGSVYIYNAENALGLQEIFYLLEKL